MRLNYKQLLRDAIEGDSDTAFVFVATFDATRKKYRLLAENEMIKEMVCKACGLKKNDRRCS